MTDLSEPVPDFDAAHFRRVLGHFPTGVCIVTAMADGTPRGLAVGSFASVSLEPPKVLFCVGMRSSTWEAIEAAGRFCVSVLAEDQEDTCRVFASKADDKFAGIGWRRSEGGSPIIEGALAWIDCTVDQAVDAGDHRVVIGDVTALDVAHEGAPLVFFRGGYGRFAQ